MAVLLFRAEPANLPGGVVAAVIVLALDFYIRWFGAGVAVAPYHERFAPGPEMNAGLEGPAEPRAVDMGAVGGREILHPQLSVPPYESCMDAADTGCIDHETGGSVIIQQWDGNKWGFVYGWLSPMRDVVRPLVEKAAAAYAKENNITPRSC